MCYFLCWNDIIRMLKNLKPNRGTLQPPDVSSGLGRPLVAHLQPSGAPLSLLRAGFLFISPAWEQQSEPPLLRHGELLEAQHQRPPSSLLLASVDVGCTMLSPRLWAALCRLLLLLTASYRLCLAARHGKSLISDLGCVRRPCLALMNPLHQAQRCA